MTSEAERIAAGLSEAQKRAVMAFGKTPKRSKHAGVSEAVAGQILFEGLAYEGTDKSGWYATYSLTPLGLAVRQILQEQNDGK